MFRFLIFALVSAFTSMSLAAVETWTCVVPGQPEGQTVKLSLVRPTFDYYLHYVTSDGQVIDRHESLISYYFVSSYQMHHSTCDEKTAVSPDGKRYEFSFKCGLVSGALSFDYGTKAGRYFQVLAPHRNERVISFSNCQLLQ